MIVEVTGVSKKSYWIYRALANKGEKVTCFCKWQHGSLGVVDSIFSDGTVILKKRGYESIIGVGYYGDLTPYYE